MVSVYGADEDLMGTVRIITYQQEARSIETIGTGDDTLNVTDFRNADELNSFVTFGVSDADDAATASADFDTLFGLDGDDTLVVAARGVTVSGGCGDDLIVMAWDSDGDDIGFNAYVEESGGGDDSLDLSAVADGLSDLVFREVAYDWNDLVIDIAGTDDSVFLRDQFSGEDNQIETLVVGDDMLDLSRFPGFWELNSYIAYGASDGDDSIVGDAETEELYGFAGDDTISAGLIDEAVAYGGDGNDVISASANVYQHLYGEAGDDTLSSNGYDWVRMSGGNGDDLYLIDWQNLLFDTAAIYIEDSGGTDTIDLSSVASSLSDLSFGGSDGALYINVQNTSGEEIGEISLFNQYADPDGPEADFLTVGDDTLDLSVVKNGFILNSVVKYGAGGTDDLIAAEAGDQRFYGLDGDDTISVTGDGGVQIFGGRGLDILSGGDDADYLHGGINADLLSGGNGNETLYGGHGGDSLDGGAGSDRIDYLHSLSVSINLATGAASGGAATGDILANIEEVAGSRFADVLAGDENANHLIGYAGDDTLVGADGADTLNGMLGDDMVDGGSGDDTIITGPGADRIIGGDGIDTAVYFAWGENFTVDLSAGTVTGGTVDGGTISGIENISISYGLAHLIGDDEANTFVASGAGSTLEGGAGDDTLTGTWERDIFVYADGSDDDLITNFTLGRDRLDISGAETDFTDFESVRAAATQMVDGLMIDLGGGDSVYLKGVALVHISEQDFIL